MEEGGEVRLRGGKDTWTKEWTEVTDGDGRVERKKERRKEERKKERKEERRASQVYSSHSWSRINSTS